MKKLLNADFRLRGWLNVPFCLEHIPSRRLRILSPEEFVFLLRCDGKTEIVPDDWPREPAWVGEENIAPECREGERLHPGQEYLQYKNRFFPYMELSITGRCNLNCRHCFSASGTAPRTEEPSREQLLALLGRMDACGVGRLRLVGGEPLVSPDFLAVTQEMSRLGMRLQEVLTNGLMITEELLDTLERQGHHPIWFVSFDGIGFHDWLRGRSGAEDLVLDKIRLLCDRGYSVQVHQCVWMSSLDSIRKTVRVMEKMGVYKYRVTPVEPSVRWKQTSPEETIPIEKWQALVPDLAEWWLENDIPMDLDIWGYWNYSHRLRTFRIVPDLSRYADRMDHIPACGDAAHMPLIDSDGRLLFCNGLSGISRAYGIAWDNVYRKDLKEILTDSIFLDRLSCTCGEMKRANPECAACSWKNVCGMGCRAEALTQGSGLKGIDRRMCRFFEDGIYSRLKGLAEKYHLAEFVNGPVR